jgi:hypothetical protein
MKGGQKRLRRPESEILFLSSAEGRLALWSAFASISIFTSSTPFSTPPEAATFSSLSLGSQINPAVSISSNRIMRLAGRFVNNISSSSSVNVRSNVGRC